ncbi:MAG: hypothetical protein AB7L17_01875 [Ilumatobacteraceae bacterium]
MIDGSDIDSPSPVFVRQVAVELRAARQRRHIPLRWLAHRSEGRFSRRELERAEAGKLPLDASVVARLTELYGIDATDVLPGRRDRLDIRPDGVIRCGHIAVTFTPGDAESLVTAYFRLTRQLRNADETQAVPLRNDDLQAINEFLRGARAPSQHLDAVLAASLAEQRVVTGSLIAGAVALGLAGLTDHSSPATATADGRTSGG